MRDVIHVVRGKRSDVDGKFAEWAESAETGKYVVATYRGGQPAETTLFSKTKDVNAAIHEAVRNGSRVEVDDRDVDGLLPQPTMIEGARPLNFETYRRSEDQVDRLADLYAKTTFDDLTFRGSAQQVFRGSSQHEGLNRFFKKTNRGGFVQYRSGLQNSNGANSDIAKVEPITEDWKQRMERVNEGLYAASQLIYAGARVEDLNKEFHKSLDPKKDTVYGNVVNVCGYRGIEDVPIGREGLIEGQMYTLGAAISAGEERSSNAIGFHFPKTIIVA